MKVNLLRNFIMISGLLALPTPLSAKASVEYVDTRVGTAYAETATAGLFGKGSEEHGQTLPAVGVPHGMNLWTPQTRDTEQKCIAPYYYADTRLQGFRNSHWINGGCTQDYGSMTIQALSGTLRTSPEARATLIDRNSEIARPDYYTVTLPDEGIKAELTGLSRTGILRFSFDNAGTGHIVVNPNSDEGQGWIEYDPKTREIRGCNPVHRIYQGWGEPADFAGYFVVKLPSDLDITQYGTFCGDNIYKQKKKISHLKDVGMYITFKVTRHQQVTVRIGTSFTSIAGAVANLDAEIPDDDFDTVRRKSRTAWKDRLNRIRVDGGSEEKKSIFYGSLYRASLLPRVISDVDGSYPSFSSGKPIRRMPEGREYYDDFSMWDTYRAMHPLITLIDPVRSGDMMNSLVIKAREGGWMPIFPCWNSYTAAMIGDHCAAAIADAAVKGINNFDLNEAYRYLRRNAFESPTSFAEYKNGMGRRALQSYLKYGYIPVEDEVREAFHDQEQTSRTLEYAFDDFALAQIAELLGQADDYDELMRRSHNYRNVIDPVSGYANGRHADGRFADGTDPFTFNDAITEGAPCHYTWYVPHDPEGLMELLGGKDKFVAKLDSMFDCGRYWHGNEPCHQIAYLYNVANRHDKTQERVRHIMETEYYNTPGGLSGNDDAGQMSAWYVFSAMGFYPVAPSTPYYYLGAPAFDTVTITPVGGKPFTIRTLGNGNYRHVSLNGKELDTRKISHTMLTQGGEMIFQ